MRTVRRHRRVSLRLLGGLVGWLLIATACGDNGAADTTQAPTAEPLVIGAPVAESGWLAAYDGPPMEGVRIAIDEFNAEGGILGRQLELVTADTKTDINLVATAGIELLEQGIEFMIASCDFDFGAPAAIEANDRGIVAMSACAGSMKFGPEGIGPFAFTMSSPAATQGAIMAEWAYAEKGFRTAYVLEDPTIDFEKQACAGFRQRWGSLARDETQDRHHDQTRSAAVHGHGSGQPWHTVMPCCRLSGRTSQTTALASSDS